MERDTWLKSVPDDHYHLASDGSTLSISTAGFTGPLSCSTCESRSPHKAKVVHFASAVDVKTVYSEWQEAIINSFRVDAGNGKDAEASDMQLYAFVQDLYKGVEVTIKKDSWLPRAGKRGILFSEDEGHSLSWLETGGSLKVHQVPSRYLVDVAEVPREGGALRLRYRARSTGTQEKSVIFEHPRVDSFSRFRRGLSTLVNLQSDFAHGTWGKRCTAGCGSEATLRRSRLSPRAGHAPMSA
ncbi:hypothetical protein JKP88DRAFT_253330 [Tribonema minus]|uniref:Uncharacterized protein n=1 Tax=Tribonema minus TaxID=303371 RepID=A0A835Z6W7_9STRA|nr:hypothetical protein JKP88DRAFT_253330 [Tribonema minus]